MSVLPNGVRLILVPMEGVNSVATSVMVAVGSRYETPQTNGISHFLEHMVFKGTKKYPTTDDVNIIERSGGLQNAYTDVDITNYHNKVLAVDWALALEVVKELAIAPLLDQKHIDKERDVILEEMKRSDDEPASKVGEIFHDMMYSGTRLGMRVIGEETSLRSVQGVALHNYHDAWYTPSQMVVTLAGAISSKHEVMSKFKEWFGDLRGESLKDIEMVKDHQTEPKVEIFTKPDAQQAHFILGLRTFRRGSEDRFGWNLFNLIMGVSFTSRLFKEIREKRGLCYSVHSGSDNWADVGYWSIYAGVATAKVEEAMKAIIHELSLAAQKGVTDEELIVARKRIKTMLAFKSEDPEFMGEYYGRQHLYGEPVMTLDDYIKKIDSVTKEDIHTLVKKYLVTRNLNLALVWSKSKNEKLQNIFLTLSI